MTSLEKTPPIREKDFLIRVNGATLPTPLGKQWLDLFRLEQQVSNHENPQIDFADSHIERTKSRRDEILLSLPGGGDPMVRRRVNRLFQRNRLEISQINHLPRTGVIFP